jgi:hypothetical protein
MAELLTKKEQRELLKIARDTIVSYVTASTIREISAASKGAYGQHRRRPAPAKPCHQPS